MLFTYFTYCTLHDCAILVMQRVWRLAHGTSKPILKSICRLTVTHDVACVYVYSSTYRQCMKHPICMSGCSSLLVAIGRWSEHTGVLDSKGHIVHPVEREGRHSECCMHCCKDRLKERLGQASNSRSMFVVYGAIVVVKSSHDWDAPNLRKQSCIGACK